MTLIPTREQPPRLAPTGGRPLQAAIAAPGAAITPRQVLRIIRKRKWLIMVTFVITMAAVTALTTIWWLYWPMYTARAYLRVAPPPTTIIKVAAMPLVGKEIIERYKRSLATLVKHQEVWNEAVKDRRITNKGWYQEILRKKKDVYEELDEAISVQVLPEEEFIRLSMTGTQKDDLADIVNAVAEHFVDFAAKAPQQERDRRVKKLKDEQNTLKSRLDSVRAQFTRIIGDSPLAAMRERKSLVAIKLENLAKAVGETELQQAQVAAALKTHEEEKAKGELDRHPFVLNTVDLDPQLRNLEYRQSELQATLENLTSKFAEKHLHVKRVRSMIDSVERQVEDRRREVTTNAMERLGQERQMLYAIATQQLADLKERLDQAKYEARDLEDQLGSTEALSREAEDLEKNLREIDGAIREQQLLLKTDPGEVGEVTPVTIAASATVPREATWPDWTVMMSLGVAVGLLLGFGLAFLLELTDTSVKTPSDIARKVDLPLLGMVPHGDDLDEEIEDFRQASLVAPHSPAAEAFRQLRTNLLFSGPAPQRRSLLVTSPAPEDGRTTVVVNLAISMAQSGRRVLIVDANFRQPALGEMFPQANRAGLSSALVGQASWRDVVSPTEVPNLFVVAAGPQPPNPAELLGSDTMRQLVSEMAEEYDQVIFDGSPTMVVADACVLSTQVDGVILVVRAGNNSVGIVQKAAGQLTRIGAHVVGVVLQGVRTTAGGYLRKNYETFYDYHQRALP